MASHKSNNKQPNTTKSPVKKKYKMAPTLMRGNLFLTVFGFLPHFKIELYIFEKGKTTDRFTGTICNKINGELAFPEHKDFKNANFTSFCYCCRPMSKNEI